MPPRIAALFALLAISMVSQAQKIALDAPQIFPSPSAVAPITIAAADFNEDGHQDLVMELGCCGNAPHIIQVMLGDGHGGLKPGASYDNIYAASIVVADFNGDGHLDLALNGDNQGLTIVFGNGDGTFQFPGVTYSAGTYLEYGGTVLVADFNGDGAPDLVISGSSFSDPGIGVLMNHGDGTFAAPAGVASSFNVFNPVIGDFNGDGKLDLVANSYTTNSVMIILGAGDGTFQAPTIVPGTTSVPAVQIAADFNGDGHLDVAANGNGTLAILLGNGDGTFQPPLTSSVQLSSLLYVADFNHDGKPDLGSLVSSGSIEVLLGKGDGTFQPPAMSFAGGTGIGIPGTLGCLTLGDFNGDGNPDFAACAVFNPTVDYPPGGPTILLGKGDGYFREPRQFVVKQGKHAHQIAALMANDFNGDGRPDVAMLQPPLISVLLNKGKGSFRPPVTSVIGDVVAVTAGDFNGDGHLDLAATVQGRKEVAIHFGIGDGTFQKPLSVPVDVLPLEVAAGDLNRDGKADLVVSSRGSISILLGNGDGTFRPGPSALVGGEASRIIIADFNNDGSNDIAVLTRAPGTLVMLLGNGDGTFQPPMLQPLHGRSPAIAIADFNADGKLDMAVASGQQISIFLGRGDGTFRQEAAYTIIVTSEIGGGDPLLAADFNGDGALDLATSTGFDLAVLPGKGNGRFSGAQYFSPGSDLLAADFDGDGKAELLVPGAVTTSGLSFNILKSIAP